MFAALLKLTGMVIKFGCVGREDLSLGNDQTLHVADLRPKISRQSTDQVAKEGAGDRFLGLYRTARV
jgi:hypothetical protein